MTLTTEELRNSWLWKHKRSSAAACLAYLSLSVIVTRFLVGTFWVIPVGLGNLVPVFVFLRLLQLYHAPRQMKVEADL
ncbi:MAG: hypothetical protein JRN06_01425 [Nitrososphaerota archaeon]|nr:hypothetical protein [Nitrososphaerota archaeon]MDG7023487.1 hypothetical protein [Nitrososphaerota archaeon]